MEECQNCREAQDMIVFDLVLKDNQHFSGKRIGNNTIGKIGKEAGQSGTGTE